MDNGHKEGKTVHEARGLDVAENSPKSSILGVIDQRRSCGLSQSLPSSVLAFVWMLGWRKNACEIWYLFWMITTESGDEGDEVEWDMSIPVTSARAKELLPSLIENEFEVSVGASSYSGG